jgi:outer membrane protein assembly factor BamB
MKKPALIVILILLSAVIIYIVIGDQKSTRVGNRSGNIYELDIDQFKSVDPSLISHRETRNYTLDADRVSGLAYSNNKLYLAADQYYQVFDLAGRQLLKVELPDSVICLNVMADESVVVGFRQYISMYDASGELIWTCDPLGERAVITALAVNKDLIFVADAGGRCVHRFNREGGKIDYFEGKTGGKDLHGFIIPSANFDLDVNAEGELWVVNPGKHALENYTDEGELRGFWENSSAESFHLNRGIF